VVPRGGGGIYIFSFTFWLLLLGRFDAHRIIVCSLMLLSLD
jgi:hypothetical protein